MTLGKRRFGLQLLVLAALLGVTNGVLARLSPDTFIARKLRSLKAATSNAATLVVGSSVVVEGVDPATLAVGLPKDWRPVANLGLHASTSAEHVQLLATALRFDRRPRVMIYGYFGVELVRAVPFDFASLTNRRAMIFSTVDDVAGPVLARQRAWDRWTIRLARPFPLLTRRDSFWQSVEALRWRLDRIGLPPLATSHLGRAAEMRRMADAQFAAGDMRAYVDGRLPLSPYVAIAIDLAQQRGMRCVFVEMPLEPTFRQAAATPLRAAFAAKLEADLAARGCRTVSAFDWIDEPAAFVDDVHLNDVGKQAFSRRLSAALAE